MAHEETLNNVPDNQLGTVVQGFAQDGALRISAGRNVDGTWNVTASFN